jgi:hypothetical protein
VTTAPIKTEANKGSIDTDTLVKPTMIEKYLQISDFVGYILDNKDLFLEEELMNIKTKEEEKKVVMTMIIKFLLETQNSIDYDKTVRLLIENGVI